MSRGYIVMVKLLGNFASELDRFSCIFGEILHEIRHKIKTFLFKIDDIIIGVYLGCQMFFEELSDEDKRRACFLLYSEKVRRETAINIKKYAIDEFNSGEFEVDHKLSIAEAFDCQVPIYMVAHPINLQKINKEDNKKKGRKSSLSPLELMDLINESDDFF
jgi:hypothetical protein